MKPWFVEISEHAVMMLNLAALLMVVLGSIEVFSSLVRLVLGSTSDEHKRLAWLRYGRWLVAALTFQLAGDILESSVLRGWNEIGRLAAVAAVRTFLNFFLDRDLSSVAERLRAREPASPA
jgi:uncharacterized membrane protein